MYYQIVPMDRSHIEQIARLDGCSKYTVRDSVEAARKKFQDFFKNRPHETRFSG